MVELFALGIYSAQWLGVVLGVGAEVVLLIAHLIALHDRKPDWLASMPAIRASQFVGLALIILSGAGAVAFHIAVGQQELLLLPIFGFKWALIIAVAVAYALEKNLSKGRALLEGFSGATWLALFLVHSVAPQTDWPTLLSFYGLWVVVFAMLWGIFVLLMRRTSSVVAIKPVAEVIHAPAPKIISTPTPQKPAVSVIPKPAVVSAPVLRPTPAPVLATPQKPVEIPAVKVKVQTPPVVTAVPATHSSVAVPVISKHEEEVKIIEKKPSLWQRFMSLFVRKHNPLLVASTPSSATTITEAPRVEKPVVPVIAQAPKPIMAAVSAPISKTIAQPIAVPIEKLQSVPANLPVVEHLELAPPQEAPKPTLPTEAYVPDWAHLPGLRVMPQKPEELHLHNRAPVVQMA